VLNNLEFDHADIFRDLADIQRTFSHLLRIVPRNGYVVWNADDANLAALLPVAWTRLVAVSAESKTAQVRIVDFAEGPEGASFRLVWQDRPWATVQWSLPGLFNARNAAMAATAAALALHPSDPTKLDLTALARFRGVRRRQDVLVQRDAITVIEDFGHHPTAIRETIRSLRARYPGREITAAFEPRSNTARTNVLQADFFAALAEADRVLLGAVSRADKLKPDERFNADSMVSNLKAARREAAAFASNADLLAALEAQLAAAKAPQLVVFFSNGSFDGIIGKLAAKVRPA
jgi:UDP-N-acetylmuramate: L-alanyl-gamma-D-glutamyl-meso-diaminopimelate ligase